MDGVDRYEDNLRKARILLDDMSFLPDFLTAAFWKGKDSAWAIKQWKRRRRAKQLRDRPKTFKFEGLDGFEGRLRTLAYVRLWLRVNHLINPQSQQQESSNGESQIGNR